MASLIPSFTVDQALLLERFLSSFNRPKDTLTYPQLAGFLFSMANAPDMIPPSEWIPMVFNDQDARYESREEAEQVSLAMMALYNHCCQEGIDGSIRLPPGCEIRPMPVDNLEATAPLRQWAQGFSMGYDYLVEIWDEYLPDEIDEEMGALLMALTFFASPRLAKTYYDEGTREISFEQLAKTVVSIFPDALREYAHLGRSIYQARLESGDLTSSSLPPPKVGRNNPCPCGSGKKFKRCCGLTM
jgi:uncharacterized protein